MISKSTCPDIIDFCQGEIILTDKPKGITSFDVIRKIRKFVPVKKIGHAGTLDPLASGLLILCTGSMTRMIEGIQGQYKIYTGEMTLGATTPCFDLEKEPDCFYETSHITEEAILRQCEKFTGNILQVPPVFSAVKFKGKAMYRHARKGVELNPGSREVTIHEFRITDIQMPVIKFYVRCSKGTYIRSLAHDFGKSLDSGAYLSELRRTGIGDFLVSDAFTPDELKVFLESKIIAAH